MTEAQLRGYVRRELLNEYGDVGYSFNTDKVWESFVNIFKVTHTAIKSVISALVLNYEIIVAPDEEAIEQAHATFANRRARFQQEYEQNLRYFNDVAGEAELFLFLVNPGAYLAYKIADVTVADYGSLRDWFLEVGIKIDKGTVPPNTRPEDRPIIDMLGGSGVEGAGSIVQQQQKLQKSIDRLFGFLVDEEAETVSESVLLKEGLEETIKKFIESGVKDLGPTSFGISEKSVEEVYKLKIEEADKYSKMLDAPLKFIEELQKAKTIEDVKRSLLIMKDAPFKIEGVEEINPKSLDDAAKKAIETAKKKNDLPALIKQVGGNDKSGEKEIFERVKAYQLRNLLGTAVVNARKTIIPQVEKMRAEFIKDFQEGAPLETVKEVAPGSKLEKIMQSGIDKINRAGKRAPAA